jgi:hypothetical protein
MKKRIKINDSQVSDVLRRLYRHGTLLEFYISMQGIRVPNLEGEGLVKATEIGERSSVFQSEAVNKTVDQAIELAEFKLRLALSERNRRNIFGDDACDSFITNEMIENICAAVHTVGLTSIIKGTELNFSDFLIEETTNTREREIDDILQTLEAKKPYLLPHLLSARAQGKNKYGDLDERPINKEILEFMGTYYPEGSLSFFYRSAPLGLIRTKVLQWLEEVPRSSGSPVDGIAFEFWCAGKLEEMGWSCVVSKASGDQGVDVIASKDSQIVAIQCKRFTAPIGNKAVQEAHAGMKYYDAGTAVVLGTGGFTKSAQELARSTGVKLIDAESIGYFEALLTS